MILLSSRIFAVFDIGTTGTRSVLVDEEGRELTKAYEEYPPRPRDIKIHEQIADTYWRTACNTMQQAVTSLEVGPDAILAVILATPRDCMTPIDKDGNALAPTVTWIDNRGTEKSKELAEEIGPRKSVNKLMWFKEEQPALFHKVYTIVHLDAFINNRLCGALVSEPTNARYGPIDHDTLKWSDELCEMTGIPVDKLADISTPGTVIGEITAEAAKATGLRKGTTVIMGSADQQCSALGTGAIKPGIVKATTGTGTFVITPTDDFIEDPYVMFSNPSATAGKWILEGVVPGTGLVYKWYRDNYCESEIAQAAKFDRDVYEIIESSAASIPAGSDGLVVFPFLAYNKGIFYNLGFNHTRAHVARAIMEANGYGIRMYCEMIEGMLDLEFDEFRIDGGGSNSPLWRQIQADCTNKTVLLPRSRDSTAIGAAILGTVGTGVYGSFEEAVSNMLHIVERREPIPEHCAVYDQLYTIYNKLLIQEMPALIELSS